MKDHPPSRSIFSKSPDSRSINHDIATENSSSVAPVHVASSLQSPITQAFKQGCAGAGAMAVNVTTLMWVRTITYFQYRHGSSTLEAVHRLYKEGGIRRFYSGYSIALVYGPISRFGDTAANAGVLCLMDNLESTHGMSISVKSACASVAASVWRVLLMPVDTVKSVLQVEGKEGLALLSQKIRTNGPGVLYHGSMAAAASNFLGHYPWFATYNYLDSTLPPCETRISKLCRSALAGFCASVASDITSNSVRVLKTYRQTSGRSISYIKAIEEVASKEGIHGVFTRGLSTKLIGNGCQGIMFSVVWKFLQD